jgi:hypothetical protein
VLFFFHYPASSAIDPTVYALSLLVAPPLSWCCSPSLRGVVPFAVLFSFFSRRCSLSVRGLVVPFVFCSPSFRFVVLLPFVVLFSFLWRCFSPSVRGVVVPFAVFFFLPFVLFSFLSSCFFSIRGVVLPFAVLFSFPSPRFVVLFSFVAVLPLLIEISLLSMSSLFMEHHLPAASFVIIGTCSTKHQICVFFLL